MHRKIHHETGMNSWAIILSISHCSTKEGLKSKLKGDDNVCQNKIGEARSHQGSVRVEWISGNAVLSAAQAPKCASVRV